jgi:hypothetical protein
MNNPRLQRWLIGGPVLLSLSCFGAQGATLQLGNLPQSGSITLPGETISYNISISTSEVVDFTASTTSGKFSPKLQLFTSAGKLIFTAYPSYPNGACTGGPVVEENTVMLAAGGYVLNVSDCSATNTGNYEIYAQSTKHPVNPSRLTFARTGTGVVSYAAQNNTYTFSATVNDEIDFTLGSTSGTFSPKLRVYKPDGSLLIQSYPSYPNGECTGGPILEVNNIVIPVSGTYTMLVADCSDTNAGDYDLYSQRLDHPLSPVNLPYAQVVAGSIASESQNNTYTFGANANDLLDFTLVTTSGKFSPKIRIYSPTGTLVGQAYPSYPNGACTGGATLEMNTLKAPVAGTYTALIADCSDTNTGGYNIYMQRTNNPAAAPVLLFGPTQTGLIGSSAKNNSYVFAGYANEVVDFTLITTTGTVSPRIRLYNPNGTLLSQAYPSYPNGACTGGPTLEMNTVKLPVSGTYTALIADCSDTNTGNYAIYAQSTNDPFSPSPLLYGVVHPDTISSPPRSNAYAFSGTAGNSLNLSMVTTAGKLSPKLRVYNPDGTLLNQSYPSYPNGACTGGSTLQVTSLQLKQTGDYAILAGDCSDTNAGSYNLSAQCFGTCPSMPAVTWPAPAAITYCTPLSATQLDAKSNVAGSFAYTPTAGSLLGIGPHNLEVTFGPSSSQYSSAKDFVQISVTRAGTSSAVVSAPNASAFGQSVAFTVTVKSSCATPTGNVTFRDGVTALKTEVLSSGKAVFSTSALSVGSHSITVIYAGDSKDIGNASPILTQVVKQASTSTTLTSSLNPASYGQSVTFTANVTSTGGVPTGTVTFINGSTTLGSAALSGGVAKLSLATLAKGTHSITAKYSGSTDFLSSTSTALSQVIK